MKLRLTGLALSALLMSSIALGDNPPISKIVKNEPLKREVTVRLKYIVEPTCALHVNKEDELFENANNVSITVSSNFSGKTEISLKDDGIGSWKSDDVMIPYRVFLYSEEENSQDTKFTKTNFDPDTKTYQLRARIDENGITGDTSRNKVPEGEYVAPVVIELSCSR
jgi:hypothetical protein